MSFAGAVTKLGFISNILHVKMEAKIECFKQSFPVKMKKSGEFHTKICFFFLLRKTVVKISGV